MIVFYEAAHGLGEDDLVRACRRHHPCRRPYCDPAYLFAAHLARSPVQSESTGHIHRPQCRDKRQRTPHRTAWIREGHEEAVAGDVHLASTVASQLASDGRAVLVQHVTPACIAKLGEPV